MLAMQELQLMKQGTISVLFGCHSIVHWLYVVKAWWRLYKKWPCLWEMFCIFVHDWGHWGTAYLDNDKEKEAHWILGAYLADRFFGTKGLELVAGHCEYSKFERSKLYYADKMAKYFEPRVWMLWCALIEPGLHKDELAAGVKLSQAVDGWREAVKKNIESGAFRGNHEIYLERRESFRKVKR